MHITTDLIQQAQSGNSQALGMLYDASIKDVYRFIYYKTFHKETAEDLTSKTFLKAFKALSRYNLKKAAFSTWIYTIAHNVVKDHYRQDKETQDIDSIWGLASDEEIEVDVDNQLQLEEILQLLKDLKPQQRELIIMRIWQQLSYKEIAEITGLSEAACKMHYARGIKSLKGSLLLFFILLNIKP